MWETKAGRSQPCADLEGNLSRGRDSLDDMDLASWKRGDKWARSCKSLEQGTEFGFYFANNGSLGEGDCKGRGTLSCMTCVIGHCAFVKAIECAAVSPAGNWDLRSPVSRF